MTLTGGAVMELVLERFKGIESSWQLGANNPLAPILTPAPY